MNSFVRQKKRHTQRDKKMTLMKEEVPPPPSAEECARVWQLEYETQTRKSVDASSRGGGKGGGKERNGSGTFNNGKNFHEAAAVEALMTMTERKTTHKGISITWRNLTYTVQIGNNKKQKTSKKVLDDMTGAAMPRHFVALMGPTGSGKTSLLNCLSGRIPKKDGTLTGEILVDGKARNEKIYRSRQVAYVMQEELLFPHLTVMETFMLHAKLRLPQSMKIEEKTRLVRSLILELGLKAVENSKIGRPGGFPRGLSGGERKRANIGIEMVANPEALFLDEPTSGLDSFQAQNVVRALQDLAAHGRTVVCTIHQPRSSIFKLFDQLLLISEGKMLYIGDSEKAVEYFAKLSFMCPDLTNPADFFMDITSMDRRSEVAEKNSRDRLRLFANKCEERELGENAVKLAGAMNSSLFGNGNAGGGGSGSNNSKNRKKKGEDNTLVNEYQGRGANWFQQFALLMDRSLREQKRNVIGIFVPIVIDVIYALILSALYRDLGKDQQGVQDRIGCLFFICLNVAYTSALPAINLFAGEKAVIGRERSSGAYSCSAYYISKYIAELPKLLPRLFFCALVYNVVGFREGAEYFWTFVSIIICEALAAQALGIFMAASLPVGAALALGPASITIFTLFGGIYLNVDSIPKGAGWIKYIDFIYYAFSALAANEFGGDVKFTCLEGEIRCLENGREILELYSFENVKVGTQVGAQFGLQLGIQFLAFWFLKRGQEAYMALNIPREEDNKSVNSDDDATVNTKKRVTNA
jgi:ABC-type multidrug transport system ATPase subunit